MMLIIATFKHSAYLELALKLLEQKGFSKSDLLVAPLEKQPRDELSEFHVAHTDGKSPYDLAFIFAMIFMLLGAIYGFIWTWGPIIWSVIGIIIGAIFGIIVEVLMGKKPIRSSKDTEGEVVLMICCNADQANTVEGVLWKHRAIGVSKIENYSQR